MGTRTGKRGDPPTSYTDAELAREIWRVRQMIALPLKRSAYLRKQLESRLHNLVREESRRQLEQG